MIVILAQSFFSLLNEQLPRKEKEEEDWNRSIAASGRDDANTVSFHNLHYSFEKKKRKEISLLYSKVQYMILHAAAIEIVQWRL